jgi:hypothetical protein
MIHPLEVRMTIDSTSEGCVFKWSRTDYFRKLACTLS